MIDLFGRKRIDELHQQVNTVTATARNQQNEINKLEASELRLMNQIREMDQLIFNMSQHTSWTEQRPYFNELLRGTNERMRLESDRIKTALIPEMQKAYR